MSRIGLLRPHLPFAVLFAVGIALRLAVSIAYHPALLLQRDAYTYLAHANTVTPSALRPILYSLFLKPLLAFHNLAVVPAVQHLVAVGVAVLLYVLLRRLGAGRWLAAAGTAPLLIDGYQLNIEQHILSETFFLSLIVAGLVLLCWHDRPSVRACLGAGLLLGLASLTRFAGMALVLPSLIYLLLRGTGVLRPTTLVVAFGLPLALYAAWFSRATGDYTVTNASGYILYGRVASFADCSQLDLTSEERKLCPEEPPSARSSRYNIWSKDSPLARARKRSTDTDWNVVAARFSRRAILAQPVDYLSTVASDFLRYLTLTSPQRAEPNVRRWRFPAEIEDAAPLHPLVRRYRASPPDYLDIEQRFRIAPPAGALRSYQALLYVPGPLLALLLLLGLGGAAGGRAGRAAPQSRAAALLFTLSAVALLTLPVMTAIYHFRYVLPALPLAGAAGSIGVALLLARRRPAEGAC